MYPAVADPDILLGATSCSGSRHSTWGVNLLCFSVSHVYFFIDWMLSRG